ncbi:hypothetical protein [uncultured Brevundimonas sp.]|uniref:hypothetical protein n=1 Tax=uncultured Brevundimonas sp. TaxID=213418 RepID=UPI0030ED8C7F|tara:strand:- start:30722 stop:31183 length:462 start_codon:yes stop_codon:yes gene_type:complete
MKMLRFVLVLTVIAYAGWLAWPFISPFLDGGSPNIAVVRAGADGLAGMPAAALWVGAVALYLISALMLGAGNPRAAIAYFLGFIADAVLRLAMDHGSGGDIAARSSEVLAPAVTGLTLDPVWPILTGLLLIGVLVIVTSRRRRRNRIPGQLAI